MIDQTYCEHHYWYDYPRVDRVRIDEVPLGESWRQLIREGKEVCRRIPGCAHTEYYRPIRYDSMEG